MLIISRLKHSLHYLLASLVFLLVNIFMPCQALSSMNQLESVAILAGEAPSPSLAELPPIMGDMRTVPRFQPELGPDGRLESPFPTSFDKTSEYMIGTVVVGIVMPQSTGPVKTEDWSNKDTVTNDVDRETTVINKIKTGLQWWVTRDQQNLGMAKLTFIYDIQKRVPTQYEPIQNRVADPFTGYGYTGEGLWITDVMNNLSKPTTSGGRGLGFSVTPPPNYCTSNQADPDYTPDCPYFYAVRSYDNYLRDKYATDWAFTIFVVDSLNNYSGAFPDGYFAYAYAGGPFLVMTYDNDGYKVANMDAVLAHEFGHIFYALDQYAGSGCTTTQISGFLNVPNGNCENGNAKPDESIMRGQLAPYQHGALDKWAMGQIGWWDTNINLIYDPVDTIPLVASMSYDASAQLIRGTASDTQNRIVNVVFKVNDIPWLWQNAIPSDGTFNASMENFQITPCWTNLEIKAINTAGNVSSPIMYSVPVSAGTIDTNKCSDSLAQGLSSGLKIITGSPITNVSVSSGDVNGDSHIGLAEIIYSLQKLRGIR